MQELLPAVLGGASECGGGGGAPAADAGLLSSDLLDSLADLLGSLEGVAAGCIAPGGADAAEADTLALPAGCGPYAAPPAGSPGCTAQSPNGTAGRHCRSSPACQPDLQRLAGAVAAAGVLLPQQHLQGGSPAGSFPGGSAAASASSGHASGGESPFSSGAVAGAAEAAGTPSHLRLLDASLQRQRSGCQDIGCIAAVTLRWMHNPGEASPALRLPAMRCCRPAGPACKLRCCVSAPGFLALPPIAEWLVEGARLIVRDRTTGRTSGAGYVTSAQPADA